MAFYSMLLVVVAFACVFLGVMTIAGFLLIRKGLKRRSDPAKGSGGALVVSGIVMLIIPAAAALILILSLAVSGIKSLGHKNVGDKWRSGWTSDSLASDEAVKCLLSAADKGDRENFSKCFTLNMQNAEGFDEMIDEFFASYPQGLSKGKLYGRGGSSEGMGPVTGSSTKSCFYEGKWYFISIKYHINNKDVPENVGVTYFSVKNLEAQALYKYENKKTPSSVSCIITPSSEVIARLIRGNAYVYDPHPERTVTEEQMKEYLAAESNIDGIIEKIGKPSAIDDREYYYYELVPENGEPRYAFINTDGFYGKIIRAYVCSDEKTFYDRQLCGK